MIKLLIMLVIVGIATSGVLYVVGKTTIRDSEKMDYSTFLIASAILVGTMLGIMFTLMLTSF